MGHIYVGHLTVRWGISFLLRPPLFFCYVCLFRCVCVCVFLYSYLRCVIFPQLTTRNGHRLDQDFDRLPRQTVNGILIRLIITVRAIRWYSEDSSLVCTGYRARQSLMHYCLSNNLVTYCIIHQSSL